MIAYVDSSVLLRVALGQPNALREWPDIQQGVCSALVIVESLRTLDRLRLRAGVADAEIATRRAFILRLIDSLRIVEITPAVLERAAQPMATELGSVDAIHLATALLWMEVEDVRVVMATHDRALAIAAQGHGLLTVGVE